MRMAPPCPEPQFGSPKLWEEGPKQGMVPPDESHFAVGTVGIVLVVGVLCPCTVFCSVSCHVICPCVADCCP